MAKPLKALAMIFAKVGTDFETTLVEMDGEDNHVHLQRGRGIVRSSTILASVLIVHWEKIRLRSSFFGLPKVA
jgi:hypothetical protein